MQREKMENEVGKIKAAIIKLAMIVCEDLT